MTDQATFGLPDGRPYPATTEALNAVRFQEVSRVERELYSAGRAAKVLPWMLLTFVATIQVSIQLGDGEPGRGTVYLSLAVVLVVAGVTTWRMLLYGRRSRELRDEARRWLDAGRTRQAYALPPVPAGTADAAATALDPMVRVRSLRAMTVPMLAILPGIFGLVLTISPLVDDIEPAWARPLLSLGGLVLLVPLLVLFVTSTRDSYRRQHGANGPTVLPRLRAVKEAVLAGDPVPPLERVPAVAAVVAVVAFLTVLGVAGMSIRDRLSLPTEPASMAATFGGVLVLLVVVGAVVAAPLVRRRALHVLPLYGPGSTVLDEPARRVTLEIDGDALHVLPVEEGVGPATFPVDDVLAVAPVKLPYALAAPALGVVTRGDPVVLVGAGVAEHPVIVELRRMLDARGRPG